MKARVTEALQKAASEFINRESNRQSLITVTHVELNPRGTHVRVFVTVFPEQNLHAAVDFLMRQRHEFREYVKKHIRMRNVPYVVFLPDPTLGGTIEEPPKA